jgi:CubicO group peptidase (beta-lactamase class C family)
MKNLIQTLFAGLLAFLLSTTAVSAQSAPASVTPAPPPVAPAPPAALDPATLENKVDELMDAHVKANGFGGAVLLARGGKPLVSKGYGYANIEWQIPATPQTKLRIGSVTKQFTSMLIMQLRERGKVKIEDSVCVYVSPCPDAWQAVTIHHLLTHTSGIPTYTGLPEWRKVNMVPTTIDEMIGFFRDLPLQWVPGEKFAYNNSGYFLLGVVVEKAAGKKYEQALQDMILTPLGMNDTGYDWPGTIIPRRASGYQGKGPALSNAAALDMQQPYSAGALYSTVEDLLVWDQALYTEKLLPAAARQIMWTPFKDGYAYGWGIVEPSAATFGHKQIAHGGGINGFSSMIIRLPETNVTAIVLSNNTSAPASPIARDLLAIYYSRPYTVPAPRTVAPLDPKVFDQYLGKYELRPDFIMSVTRDGNRFLTQATGQNVVEIFPMSDTKFFPKVIDAEITFVKSADGTVTHLMLTQNGRNQMAKKIQ